MLEIIRVKGFEHPHGTVGHLQTWLLFGLESEVRAWAENRISPLFCFFFYPYFSTFLGVMVRDGIKVSFRWEKLPRKSRRS